MTRSEKLMLVIAVECAVIGCMTWVRTPSVPWLELWGLP
jgi:hypothetical protein